MSEQCAWCSHPLAYDWQRHRYECPRCGAIDVRRHPDDPRVPTDLPPIVFITHPKVYIKTGGAR